MAKPDPSPVHDSDPLFGALQAGLHGWHRARLKCLHLALVALLSSADNVSLPALARRFGGHALTSSVVRRLQRFFAGFDSLHHGQEALGRLLAAWSGLDFRQPQVLCLDRSDWQPPGPVRKGLGWTNLLVLGVVREGVAYPLLWQGRPKKGSSGAAERIALMERYLALFGAASVRFIAQDREFGTSVRWLRWLEAHRLDYRIRLTCRRSLSDSRGRPTSVGALYHHLGAGQAEGWARLRRLDGHLVWVAALRLSPGQLAQTQAAKATKGHRHPGDELVVVVGSAACLGGAPPADLLGDYGQRWAIENLFSALKTRGFNLEATRLGTTERVERLVGLVALGFAWAHRSGLWVAAHRRPLRWIAKIGRPAQSFLRAGLDLLCRLLTAGGLYEGAAERARRRAEYEQLLAGLNLGQIRPASAAS